ncbi:hypothetical protein Pma05_82020 [Plantactinospora mayteni]|uniref:DUF3558 domain-containing protein n=1 Tax=Plantactinospora mayteni TaxID=566021 RepID=A0ABQ4F426_9ACTN|nr:hypothetical protein Pma05_82020 [Plantactinospora mayteni]
MVIAAVVLLSRNSGPADPAGVAAGTPTASSAPLVGVDPCTLLSGADASTLQLDGGESKVLGAARTCGYEYRGERSGYIQVYVVIYDRGTPDGLDLTGPRPVTIGKHTGITGVGGLRTGCSVALLVGTSSTLEVELLGLNDRQKACELVTRVATVVEPQLS